MSGGLFGGGKKENVSTQTTSYPDWLNKIMEQSTTDAYNLMKDPGNRVAPFSQDQLDAMQNTRAIAGTAMRPNTPVLEAFMGGHYLTKDTTNQAANANAAAIANSAVTGQDVMGKMNPFNEQVIARTMDGMRDRFGEASSGLQSQFAASNAFGGARDAIARSQMASDFVKNAGNTEAQMRQQGWSEAANRADNEKRNILASQMANENMRVQGMSDSAGKYLAGLQGQDNQFGSNFDRQLRAATALGGVGDAVQQMDQRKLDVPYDLATWIRGFLPGYPATTTQVTPNYNNNGGLIGGALTAASLFL